MSVVVYAFGSGRICFHTANDIDFLADNDGMVFVFFHEVSLTVIDVFVTLIPYMTFVLLSIKMQELSLQQILGFGLYPFILPDLGKLVVAVFLADRIKAITKKNF